MWGNSSFWNRACRDVVLYGMVWYGMVWCGVVWCGMVRAALLRDSCSKSVGKPDVVDSIRGTLCDKSITPLRDFLIVKRWTVFVVSCWRCVVMWWVITTRIGDVRFCFVCFVVVNIIMPRGHSKRAVWV